MTVFLLCWRRASWFPRSMRAMMFVRNECGYTQGQSPAAGVREYFYYIDHQGQLFLDDTKMKNFVTCYKDQKFLVFFFKHLKVNTSGRYQQHFPFLSLCGRERNFLRCDDQPIVFTNVLSDTGPDEYLSYCGGGAKLIIPFRPEALFMHPETGRVYHPASNQTGGIGLVCSSLAFEFSLKFQYVAGQDTNAQPSYFLWAGQRYTLTNELKRHF